MGKTKEWWLTALSNFGQRVKLDLQIDGASPSNESTINGRTLSLLEGGPHKRPFFVAPLLSHHRGKRDTL